MIQLTHSGFTCSENLDAMRAQFDAEHCLCLPNLIHPDFRPVLESKLVEAEFTSRHYDAVGDESRMAPNLGSGLLQFMLNDESVFAWVRQVTGCESIGCFQGRVYRMMPGRGHSFDWHDDCHDDANRLITISVNLGAKAFAGGTLEIRDAQSKQIAFRAPRLNWGDALMFRISRSLEHRVTPVEPGNPKIAFAGWFLKEPVFSSALHDRAALAGMYS